MKKVVTLDAAMVSFISAMGYGFGYAIPSAHGANGIVSFVVCMVLGSILAAIADKVVFNDYIQSDAKRRYAVFGAIVVIFAIGYVFLERYYAHSLWSDVGADLASSVVIPIVFFVLTMCVEVIKQKKLLKKYGTGESGFLLDEEIEKLWKSDMGENARIEKYEGKNPAVKTTGGTYIGKADKTGVSFLGIPYAKPPVGEDRWKAPIPVTPSDEVFEAYYFGNTEIQPKSNHNILNRFRQDEDCLNLNIWTSKLETSAKKPVFVYFHGGDGRYGGSAYPVDHLKNIAANIKDAVFVSFNYRFGLFGVIEFDSSAAGVGEEYKNSTALTLLDQIEALKWIKTNISAFGGDPDNITVAGDNIGGSCICLLSSIKEAKGLFKRALIMCASTADVPVNSENALLLGKKLFEEFGVNSVSELGKITSDKLRDFAGKYYGLTELPPRDGKFVPTDVEKEFISGTAADIEFIFGIASDEFSGWQAMLQGDVSFEEMCESYYLNLKKAIGDEQSVKLDEILKNYMQSGLSEGEAKKELLIDFQYKSCVLHDIKTLVKGGSKVRAFYWDVKGNVEKFAANSVSMVTTILGNEQIAEQLGYLNDKSITEIVQSFIRKFMNDESLKLFNNELKGVSAIEWNECEEGKNPLLHIKKGSMVMADDMLSDKVLELEKVIFGD